MLINNNEWKAIKDILENEPRDDKGRSVPDMRKVVSAILWVCQSNAAWLSIPADYAASSTCNSKYRKWKINGTWDKILYALACYLRDAKQIDITLCFCNEKFIASRGSYDTIRAKQFYCDDTRSSELLNIFLYKEKYTEEDKPQRTKKEKPNKIAA